jgi:type IV pilus assembly protein PilB
MTQLSIDVANRITARLKVMSTLDISERRIPQDGRFTIEINSQESRDCRISTCPTLFGEKTVVRILDVSKSSLSLDDLGLEPQQKTLFLSALHKPQGLMLVTGPTGSGKTITLYTALNILNTLDKNISTAEDPVEIQLPGLNQVNANSKIDLTFSKILRAFLRQDPDVIMIGEIRDLETADIALKAAQTGHFVLSTLHTNSAAETLNRLLMMGVSNFNLVHSIQLIIAQRLIRKLCEYCKHIASISKELFTTEMNILIGSNTVFYEAQGCERCMKGYSGRTGIFEFLPITPDIMKIISNNGNVFDITTVAKKTGTSNLKEAAFNKLRCGITSFEEIRRVVL